MTYATADAQRQLLDTVVTAADAIGLALAHLGAAYELLDEASADTLEGELFRPLQTAYGRAKRTSAGFAERCSLPAPAFAAAAPGAPSLGARGLLDRAVAAAMHADSTIATLQDSMLPVEVGDGELRAGLAEVRSLLANLPARARRLTGLLGR